MYSDTAHCITCKAYVHQCLVVVYVCSRMSQKKFSDSWDVPEMSKRTRKLQVQCSFHVPVYVLFYSIFITCCTSAHDIDVHSNDFIAGPMQFVDTESVLQVEFNVKHIFNTSRIVLFDLCPAHIHHYIQHNSGEKHFRRSLPCPINVV